MSLILASWSSLIHHLPRKDPAKKDLALCSTSTALFESLKNQSPQGIPEHGKPFPTGQACKKQKLNKPTSSSQGAMPSQSSPAVVLRHHKVTAESAARGGQTATSSCSSWSSRGSAEPKDVIREISCTPWASDTTLGLAHREALPCITSSGGAAVLQARHHEMGDPRQDLPAHTRVQGSSGDERHTRQTKHV